MSEEGTGTLNQEQLDRLVQHFNEEVEFARHIKLQIEEVEPGGAVLYTNVEATHLNGSGSLHGGVYASLLDTGMGLSLASLVGLRVATTQMNVHFLEPVREGRITCRSEVIHSTRRTATVEGRVYDEEGNLVAMGTGAFRIFERKGSPIV
ncbi:MAG: PaaI family thioesterase [Rubrobacter sp.]|nr:PaaI family thioesterase [Rubrobacter sp.]